MLKITKMLAVLLVVLAMSTPAAAGWMPETFRLIGSDTAAGDYLGGSVGISGDTAIVGAFGDDDAGNSSGSAYVFDVTTGNPELRKLTASDAAAGDYFGRQVAISGNTAIVGAYLKDDVGANSGAAYLFDVTTGNPELRKLIPSDTAASDQFGEEVAIDGNTAIVGAWNATRGGFSRAGAAYLYDVTTGAETILAAPGGLSDELRFGIGVGISDNIAIAGARDAGGGSQGMAFLFDATTGAHLSTLTASDGAANDWFSTVDISGDTAIVGAYRKDNNTGAAYLFDVSDPENPVETFTLTASDAAANDWFGRFVEISGDIAICSAPDKDSGRGAAYLFDVTTGDEIVKLLPSDPSPFPAWAVFGSGVAIDGNVALVGAENAPGGGSAYVFVPEPSSFILLTMGAVKLLGFGCRRKRRQAGQLRTG